jgi:hypothetical protein
MYLIISKKREIYRVLQNIVDDLICYEYFNYLTYKIKHRIGYSIKENIIYYEHVKNSDPGTFKVIWQEENAINY